jgi:hypothetical protein
MTSDEARAINCVLEALVAQGELKEVEPPRAKGRAYMALADAVDAYRAADSPRVDIGRITDGARQGLFKHMMENGVAYTSCPGCGWAYDDHPAAILPAIKGRDCGCPCGSGVTIRKAQPLDVPSAEALERVIGLLEQEIEKARMLRWKPDMVTQFRAVAAFLRAVKP